MTDTFSPYHAWLGLPESLIEPNHYELLAIRPFESDATQISQAADLAFAKVRNLGPGSQAAAWAQLLARVTTAKDCLLDPARKAEYDVGLRRISAGPAPAAAYNPQAPVTFAPHPAPGFPGQPATSVPYYAPAPYVPQIPQAMPTPQQFLYPQTTPVFPAAYQPPAPAPAPELPRSHVSARLAGKYSRQGSYGLMAAAIVGTLLFAGAGMFLLAGIMSQGTNSGDGKQTAKGGKGKAAPATPVVKPNPAIDPRRKPEPEPNPPPKSEYKPNSKPKPETNPEPEPTVPPTPEELAALGRALKAARLALGNNALEDADEALVRAASLAKRGEHKAKVERLKELAHYVSEFWRAVEAGRQDLRGGDELEIGSTRIAVVEPGPGKFIYKSQGALSHCELRDIPGGIAVVIAKRKLNGKDATTNVILGAIYAASKNADKKAEARRHWEAALAGGADVKDMLLVLDDTYDFVDEE